MWEGLGRHLLGDVGGGLEEVGRRVRIVGERVGGWVVMMMVVGAYYLRVSIVEDFIKQLIYQNEVLADSLLTQHAAVILENLM